MIVDWRAWHEEYAAPDSPLGRRLAVVQCQLSSALDRAPAGTVHVISLCAGQGHDLIGVLADHKRRAKVCARLVELDAHNAQLARDAARDANLGNVEVLTADAAMTDSYAGAVPADVVLLCGVFGNITAEDIARTVRHLPSLCAAGASVIWTRHRHPPDLTPLIRETFINGGFDEIAFKSSPPFGIGVNRLRAAPKAFEAGIRLFEFIGYDVLERALHKERGSGVRAGDSER
jgi:hypothetical protein